MKRILVVIIGVIISVTLFAEVDNSYDFVHNGIRYKILSELERTVETRCLDIPEFGYPDPYDFKEDEVVLPKTLEYNGIEYTLLKIGEMTFYKTTPKRFIIPKTVREIGSEAFADSDMEEIINLDSIEIIRFAAFAGTNLREAVLSSDRLQRMEKFTFLSCHKLRRIELPATDTYAIWELFTNINPYEIKCNALIPPPEVVFGYNEYEKEDNIPKNTWIVVPAKSVELYRKDREWGRWDDKILPDNYALDTPVLFESDGLFFSKIAYSDSLVAIVRPPKQFMEHPYGYGVGGTFTVPSKVTFQGKEYTVHAIGGFMDSEYEEIVLPPTVNVIDRLAFIHSKVRRINTEHVTEIRHQAFHGSDIEEIKISNGTKLSVDGTFYECKHLKKVDLPVDISLFSDGNVYDLDYNLFSNCLCLTDLICRGTTPFDYGADSNRIYDAIFGVYNNKTGQYSYISPTVWVPKGAIDAYREAWGKYTDDFRELEEEQVYVTEVNTDEQVAVTVSDGTAQISGVEGAAVTITSVSGRRVYSTTKSPDNIRIKLPHGIYLLTVDGYTTKLKI